MFYLCNITQKNFCKEGSEFMDIKQLIGETTDYDKKLALEEKKPKSWCKSISAFANCFGGKLIFGVSNDSELVGTTPPSPCTSSSMTAQVWRSTISVRASMSPALTYWKPSLKGPK